MPVPSPAPSPRQVAAAWLDGAGAAFATRLTKTATPRQPLTWVIDVRHPMLAGKPIRLVLPRAFPAEPARIYVDKSLCLGVPHIEEDGRVCLGVEAQPGDYANPCGAIERAIKAFQVLLELSEDPARVQAELQRERLSYWRRFVARRCQSDKRRRVLTPAYVALEPFTSSAEGKVAGYNDGTGVACFGDADPNVLARRHHLAHGTLQIGLALYVAMPATEPWTPSTWPTTFAQLDSLVTRLTDGARSVSDWLLQKSKGEARHSALVVFVQETLLFGYQVMPTVLPKVTRPTIEPIGLTRIDPAWALARDQQPSALASRKSKRVLVLGCGALGSPVVEMLARAGVGDIDVVDCEFFDVENCARHILGMSAVGQSKAVALTERVNREVPGATVNGVPAMASAWVMDRCQPGDYDVIVDCTGESSVRILLANAGTGAFGESPIVHAWMEPYCAAAHVVLVCPPDTWPDSDPADQLVNAADWPPTRIDLPACSAGFHAYGVADAWQAAGFLAERILHVLDGKVSVSTIWSWVRAREFFDALGIAVTPRDIVPDGDSGFDAVTITRRFHDVLQRLG